MAGKSPDKSEQQKSSGETTPEERAVPETSQPSTHPDPVDPRTQLLHQVTSEDDSDESGPSEDSSTAEAERTDPGAAKPDASEVDTEGEELGASNESLDASNTSTDSAPDADKSGDTGKAEEDDIRDVVGDADTDTDTDTDSSDSDSSVGDSDKGTRLSAAVAAQASWPGEDGDGAPSAPSGASGAVHSDAGVGTTPADASDDTDATASDARDESDDASGEKDSASAKDRGPTPLKALPQQSATAASTPADDAPDVPEARTTPETSADKDAPDSDSDSDSDEADPREAGAATETADAESDGGESDGGESDGGESDGGDTAEDDEDPTPAKDRGTTTLKALAKPAPSDADESDDTDADDDSTDSGGADSESSKAPEVPERKSQFVPLRSSDDPLPAAPPRPAGPPPEAPAGPPAEVPAERTRQQPLPPVPGQRPLDLLAQLTNKPAPPETPMRTLVRRVKIWTPLMGLLVLAVIGAQLLRPVPSPELELTAQPTHTFDGGKPAIEWPDAGQAALEVDGLGSLGTSGEQKPVPIASVAKTMTAYLLLRDHPMKARTDGAKIKVDKQAEEDAGLSEQGESTVEVTEGETITQREALNAVMVASANNVARLVARWDAGSEKDFVSKMNEAAEDLGMENTTYTDPSGLRKETVSTAEDQVKLGKAVMKYRPFRETVKVPSYVDRNGKKQDNWNRLVPLYGTVGIKTGTTTAAGGNLLFAAEKEIGGTKQLIIGAVLGQHQPPIIDSVLAAGRELIQSTQDALESETILKKGTTVGTVDNQLGASAGLVTTEDVTAVGWAGLEVKLDLAASAKGVPETADAGTEVGTLTIGRGPRQVKVPVALEDDLPEASTTARLFRVT